ncbi:hypothetical protein MMC13_001617, partial [Lambiella insularis]|nr:hypothetical protein [Lambiella insularis]
MAALVIGSSLTTVFAVPGVVQYDLVKRQQPQGTDTTVLGNLLPIGSAIYTINITAGTPPQPMTLQIDTGSSDIEVLATSVCQLPQAVCNPKGPFYVNAGSYNSTASSTANFVSNGMTISYADTTAFSGSLYTDTVNVGGVDVTNMTLAVVQTATAPPNLPINGILGIGYPGGEAGVVVNGSQPYPSILQQMKSQGVINSLAFSLYLIDKGASTGSILFGGTDNTKYSGILEPVPVLPGYNPPRYIVPWTSLVFSVNGANITLLDTPIPALLDSGNSVISLTPDLANAILGGLGFVNATAPYILPCFLGDGQTDFFFGFNNDPDAIIDVPLRALMSPLMVNGAPQVDEDGDALCQLSVDAAASGWAVLGDSFMRSAYFVFDLEDNYIFMAQAVLNSTTSNVQAIGTASGIAATTVATTVTVSVIPSQTSVVQNTAGLVKPTAATVSIAQGSPTFKITATGKSGSATGAAATTTAKSAAGSARGPAPVSVAVLIAGFAALLSF